MAKGARQLTRSAHRCKIYGSAFIAKPREKNVNGAAALQMKAWHDTSRGKARLRDKCRDEQTSRPQGDSESRFGCKTPKKALVEVQVFSVGIMGDFCARVAQILRGS